MLRKSPVRTPALLAANRRNALNSTGPRTIAGKARVALNGLKHGRYARHLHRRLLLADDWERAWLYRGVQSVVSRVYGPRDLIQYRDCERMASEVWSHLSRLRDGSGPKPESPVESNGNRLRIPGGSMNCRCCCEPVCHQVYGLLIVSGRCSGVAPRSTSGSGPGASASRSGCSAAASGPWTGSLRCFRRIRTRLKNRFRAARARWSSRMFHGSGFIDWGGPSWASVCCTGWTAMGPSIPDWPNSAGR